MDLGVSCIAAFAVQTQFITCGFASILFGVRTLLATYFSKVEFRSEESREENFGPFEHHPSPRCEIQSSVKNDAKPADTKKPILTKSPTESKKPDGAAPTSPGPTRPKTTRPAAPRPLTRPSASADAKKVPTTRPAPLNKPIPAPKQPRPATAPDVKNIRSKIGSTDNLKHQPGGGKANVENKPVPASTARKPVPPAAPKPAASKPADTKEAAQKQSNGKVQIVSKKANYSHVQSKCGSKDNIKHVPGGGNVTNSTKPSVGAARLPASGGHKPGSANVQILNKRIDVSKVLAKSGSKAGTKQKTGKYPCWVIVYRDVGTRRGGAQNVKS
ncbi:PREDICTED: microtubule-associated protein 4-like [Nanorana parkeri]|uniref:microtubule-associated protein 4-like n=1 Tax=Nanorana parkeri TaxID=125878 RepID=UPI000854D298|nr:PREDICTED: microtubule-associated protein 4-like [Nanorana parkeri]